MGPGKIIGAITQVLTTPLPFIRVIFHFFLACGTNFKGVSVFVGHVAASQASDAIARHPSRGLGSTRSSSKHVRQKGL